MFQGGEIRPLGVYGVFSTGGTFFVNARCTIKSNSDFRRMYTKGKSAVNPYLVLYCRRNRTGNSRVGFTVSAKLGHAVVRNRVRRRYREIYRLNSPALRPGYDLIIVARARSADKKAKYSSMNSAFLDACRKLNLMKAEG